MPIQGTRSGARGKEIFAWGSIAIGAVLVVAACSKPLPEEGSAAAELYRQRCGTCHRPVSPSSMKFALWRMMLPRMEERMRQAGQPPLSNEERTTLESYLERNGG